VVAEGVEHVVGHACVPVLGDREQPGAVPGVQGVDELGAPAGRSPEHRDADQPDREVHPRRGERREHPRKRGAVTPAPAGALSSTVAGIAVTAEGYAGAAKGPESRRNGCLDGGGELDERRRAVGAGIRSR
jgi:hypothetical protein